MYQKPLDKPHQVWYNKDVERENLQKKGIDTMYIITVSHEEKSTLVQNVRLTLYCYEEELYLPEELREYYETHVLDEGEFDDWLDENYNASEVIDDCRDDYWEEFVDNSFNEWVEDYTTHFEKEIQITIR